MKEYYEKYIKPLNDELGRLLEVKDDNTRTNE